MWYSCLYQTPTSAVRKSRKESQSPSCWDLLFSLSFGVIFHGVGAISLLCLLYLEIRGRNIQFYISQDSRALITLFLSLRASISSTLIISSLPSGWNNWKYNNINNTEHQYWTPATFSVSFLTTRYSTTLRYQSSLLSYVICKTWPDFSPRYPLHFSMTAFRFKHQKKYQTRTCINLLRKLSRQHFSLCT